MRYFKIFFATIVLFISAGCASLDCKPTTGKALPGTDTIVVGIYIDKKGYPQANIDTIRARPGQKIIFVGPDKFEIFFKDQNSPIDSQEVRTSNNVLTIEIPENIFEREQRKSKATDSLKELIYRYGIRANGKETDPQIVVSRT